MQPPTVEYLAELHKAHVEKVPWHTVDTFAGKPIPIDSNSSLNHILNYGSGYCFHLNGAFILLLRSVGYDVSIHRAGVQSQGDEPRINSLHMGLSVNIMDENQNKRRWVIDVGLGDNSQWNYSGIVKNEVIHRSDWFEILGEVFGEKLNRYSTLDKNELWTKVKQTHEDWKRQQNEISGIMRFC